MNLKRLIYKLQNRFMRACGSNINYVTLKRMVKANSKLVLIDVRARDEFRYKHLDGAVNIPLQDISEKKIQQFVRNKTKRQ